MPVKAEVAVEGVAIRYYTLADGDRRDVLKFIMGLPDEEEAKVMNYLVTTAMQDIQNRLTVKKEEGDVWRIRPPGSQVRLYFCWGKGGRPGEKRIVIVHCVRKKRQRARREDLAKAQRLVDRFRAEGEPYEDG